MTALPALLAIVLAIAAPGAAIAQDVDQVADQDVSAAPAPAPASDAPGAIEVASKFMKLVFNRQQTTARVVGVQGDWADVVALPFPKTTCELKLHREPITNPDGWAVKLYSCKSENHKATTIEP